VGQAEKFVSKNWLGYHAVRWDASSTAATELGNLGTNKNGFTASAAYAINSAGTAVGYADKFESGNGLGYRAVRWYASGTVATELGHIGTDSNGSTSCQAQAVNDANTTGHRIGPPWH
jgi:hypothetical protein